MTRENAKNIAEAISFKIKDRQRLSLVGVNEIIDQIFNDHEAQIKAKDKEIVALKAECEYDQRNAARSQRESVQHLEKIERLKAELKQSYIEGSKSCDDLLSFYITKIASLEEKLKVSNDSAIK